MKPEPHLVVGDSFADGAGASAAGDFDLARPTDQVFSVPRHADGPAALLAPVPKVALFFLSAHPSTGPHHDATNIVVIGRLVGDEDPVVIEAAVGDEHVEVDVQLQG